MKSCAPGAASKDEPQEIRLRRSLLLLAVALLLATNAPADGLRLNEILPGNQNGLRDEDGDTSDWIELFNDSNEPADLTGYGLSDNHAQPFKWKFAGGTLAPGAFAIVFASGKDRQPIAPPAINPATLPGLRVWLDASRVNTNDAAQVRTNGSFVFVRQWLDQSGSGNHAVSPADLNQPIWLAAALKGKPALRFDGFNDLLRLSRSPGTDDFCIFAVVRSSLGHEIDPEASSGASGTSGQRYLFGAQHGGDANAGAGISVGTNGVSVYEHGSSYMPARLVYSGPLAAGPCVIALNYSAKAPALDIGGFLVRSASASPRAQVIAPVEIGSGAYGFFTGDVAEILIFDRSLSFEERRGVEGYLVQKYGLETSLSPHTSFQLSSGGEEVVLTRPNGTLEDKVTFGIVPTDVSLGRGETNGAWLFYAQPTPGRSNSTPGSIEFLAAPAFSHPAGFYSNAFQLQITNPSAGAEIRYTLDGSEPAATSLLFTNALDIRSRAGTPNDLSNIPTTPGGPVALGEVFKGWVIRARAFKAGALPSPVSTRTFWVDPKGRARYSLPVISLSTARSNFFDARIGIYVPGNAAGGNYSQRGPDWERMAHVEFIETNNVSAFAQEVDVKIHGNTSQNFPIKGLDLDATGGRGMAPFKYRIFPDQERTEFEHILLRPTGHDQQMAFMRDELLQSFGAETGAEYQAARACVVFINGEYFGLHYLKEKEDADLLYAHAPVAGNDLDFLEGYATAREGDTAHYDALIQYLAGHDPADPAVYDEVGGRMELANYIDYKACEIFCYRWDIGNHRLWRPRIPEGRWRWLQFDNDVGWGGFWAIAPAWEFNMLAADLTPSGSLNGHNNETTTFLLRRLLLNPQFQRDFINRFADLLNSIFLPPHTLQRIDQMVAVLQPEMAEHTRRWRAPSSLTDWSNQVLVLRNFANNRPKFMRQDLVSQFKLGGTVQLALSVSDTNRGVIQVNTLKVAAPTNSPWSETYFKGNSIPLRAIPKPGFHFVRWQTWPAPLQNPLTLDLTGDFSISAEFAPDILSFGAIRQNGGKLQVEVSGPPNSSGRVQTSANLQTWTEAESFLLDSGGKGALSFSPVQGRQQFYRLVLPQNQ